MTDDVFGFHEDDLRPSVNSTDRSQRSQFSKRSLDLFGSVLGIITLLPLFACLSVAIKLTSKGPIFFKQKRHGLNGNLFTVYKFRSMYTDRCDKTGVDQTVKNDPRVTPVGRILRRCNFDELPQLINVLKGEMSLVGPRPHVPGMLANGVPYEVFDPRYQSRHKVKPGITGLAQVKGCRGETKDASAASMRLKYDLEYIDEHSLFLDVKIIFNTLIQEFCNGKGY
ncbi:lipopolysaccharide/colanic/teichoic acid biosynthesis glycosyltransferase [Labrenzia sp. EL_126]|nr:lipopolysaccharide/colanic/teichoic acid biosynthesis glycosyltransferase [Labrenzia sp. EL_126]